MAAEGGTANVGGPSGGAGGGGGTPETAAAAIATRRKDADRKDGRRRAAMPPVPATGPDLQPRPATAEAMTRLHASPGDRHKRAQTRCRDLVVLHACHRAVQHAVRSVACRPFLLFLCCLCVCALCCLSFPASVVCVVPAVPWQAPHVRCPEDRSAVADRVPRGSVTVERVARDSLVWPRLSSGGLLCDDTDAAAFPTAPGDARQDEQRTD